MIIHVFILQLWKDLEGKKKAVLECWTWHAWKQCAQLTPDTSVPSSERQAVLAEVLVETACDRSITRGMSSLISAS